MFLEALNTARDLGRLHDIASVLVRHGLGDAVRRLGLARLLERAGRAVHWNIAAGLERPPSQRVREALEELGPTFVKVGQLLAGRSDLLSPEWTAELEGLHENAAPVPIERIRVQLREDLGAAPEEVFAHFDPDPLASASIAQVHRARLLDGTEVVLKVRRPEIEEVVEADLRLLARLAERAEESLPEVRRFRPRRLVRQFARSLRDELDLRVEARNAERLRRNLEGVEGLLIPRIHGEWTTTRLCVMDFIPGESLGEWLRNGDASPDELSRVATLGADTVLHTVFVDGFFHADPHPGNVLLMEDGRLALVDFGMVGTLSEPRRREFLGLLLAVVSRDVETAVDTLLGWADGAADEETLTQETAAFIDRYHSLSLAELDTSELLADLTTLLRENDLALPGDVALLLKVFVTLDGLGRSLDPEFVMAARIEPFARDAWRREHSPMAILRRGSREMHALLRTLPRDLRMLGTRLRRGKLHVDVRLDDLDRFGERLTRSANRITLGLVTAALIVGTSISLTIPGGPRLLGLPVFGLLGFTSSFALGVWLLWSVQRSGTR